MMARDVEKFEFWAKSFHALQILTLKYYSVKLYYMKMMM
jgi:hypothetical protein